MRIFGIGCALCLLAACGAPSARNIGALPSHWQERSTSARLSGRSPFEVRQPPTDGVAFADEARRRLLIIGNDTLSVYDVSSRRILTQLSRRNLPLGNILDRSSVRFLEASARFSLGHGDVLEWNWTTGEFRALEPGHSPSDDRIVSLGPSERVDVRLEYDANENLECVLFDRQAHRRVRTLRRAPDSECGIELLTDAWLVFRAEDGRTIRILDVQTGEQRGAFRLPQQTHFVSLDERETLVLLKPQETAPPASEIEIVLERWTFGARVQRRRVWSTRARNGSLSAPPAWNERTAAIFLNFGSPGEPPTSLRLIDIDSGQEAFRLDDTGGRWIGSRYMQIGVAYAAFEWIFDVRTHERFKVMAPVNERRADAHQLGDEVWVRKRTDHESGWQVYRDRRLAEELGSLQQMSFANRASEDSIFAIQIADRRGVLLGAHGLELRENGAWTSLQQARTSERVYVKEDCRALPFHPRVYHRNDDFPCRLSDGSIIESNRRSLDLRIGDLGHRLAGRYAYNDWWWLSPDEGFIGTMHYDGSNSIASVFRTSDGERIAQWNCPNTRGVSLGVEFLMASDDTLTVAMDVLSHQERQLATMSVLGGAVLSTWRGRIRGASAHWVATSTTLDDACRMELHNDQGRALALDREVARCEVVHNSSADAHTVVESGDGRFVGVTLDDELLVARVSDGAWLVIEPHMLNDHVQWIARATNGDFDISPELRPDVIVRDAASDEHPLSSDLFARFFH